MVEKAIDAVLRVYLKEWVTLEPVLLLMEMSAWHTQCFLTVQEGEGK